MSKSLAIDLRTVQAVSCSTFRPAPLDGSLTLVEIFDYNGNHNPKHPLFCYDGVDGRIHVIDWSRAIKAIHAAARISQRVLPTNAMYSIPPTVVAILAVSDTTTYFTFIAGLMRAGFLPFPISTRNSSIGVAHLLRSTGSNLLYVSRDTAMQKLAKDASEHLSSDSDSRDITMLPMPVFDDLYAEDVSLGFLPPIKCSHLGQNTPAVILHSSGSTAFPKPVTLTYGMLLQQGILPYYGEVDICGQVLAAHSVPMFHLMGVIQIPWTTAVGLTIALFPPSQPPIIPTPDRVFESAVATKCTLVFCVPAFLESWARDPDRVAVMKNFNMVIFAGGPLQAGVGDMLVDEGISICPLYGLTETGTLTTFLPKSSQKEGWGYFYVSPHCDPVFKRLDGPEDVYRLIVKECPSHTPAILNVEVDGVRALDTRDLFVRHPRNSQLWKLYGREDEQLMHSTGEKTNPVPIEAILLRDEKIASAIMFGRGKFHAGVLIAPAPGYEFDPTDTNRLARYRNEIWGIVQQANEVAPSHSRIFKEMIIVASPSKPFEYTPKGTPRRHVVLEAYKTEIDNAYTAVEKSSQTYLVTPVAWGPFDTLNFARQAVKEVMLTSLVDDDDDIFRVGCDSLQATWIRNTILHALRASKINTREIPYNFVYLNPTIQSLGKYMQHLTQGQTPGPISINLTISSKVKEMEELAQRYALDFPQHCSSDSKAGKLEDTVVLITGTTGSFGTYLLEQLLSSPAVSRVYALNRKSKKSRIQDRQAASLVDKGLDPKLVESSKLKLIEADLTASYFGLKKVGLYDDMVRSVTCIIHNAWHVDFNVSLSTMEPFILGTRHLIDFALESPRTFPPRLIFTSSIGVFRNWTSRNPAPESPLHDLSVAVGSGYSESKAVAEQLLGSAAGKTPLDVTIIRVGQLCGGSEKGNGSWNTTEWFPSLVRSSQNMGCVPIVRGRISWIPIDIAATAIMEIIVKKSNQAYLHLVHPNAAPASVIFDRLSNALKMTLVPYLEWISRLEAAASNFDSVFSQESPRNDNPGVQLLDFFRSKADGLNAEDGDAEAFGIASMENNGILAAAPSTLKDLGTLGVEDVKRWIGYWKSVGFLDN